ncbi:MAG: ABC transporter substrate binding protein [Kurthia gibsonii]|uniref:ABC transporter substrate-binding protein n=1 Tax=Kurthia TaxID=1649 RepID=UPI000745D696|nr:MULTISPECIES: ABC transporter substrate-binding protein [Kurthia]AMA62712.1 ABC transporter substrate binding family protein [Kurthia sp. 11kri321]MEB6113037.1 ABC transporter substrate-binding protein [Kurthia gibsonii]RXH52560.1 ABC transporter substrate-binding protein [Kurthia gibsonii]WIL38952.1 ABC transporter substrate-binding protein [Kurthia sp. YJT4]HZG11553.1 ABC transporter substrate-binding protein [Kurthia gibsonii]
MKKKSMLLLLVTAAIMLVLAACGKKDETQDEKANADEKTYKVGILQYVEHPSLNEATKGFKAALKESGLKVEYDEQNAQGDPANNTTAANNLVGAGNDLIFANATPSAQAVQTATADIPVLFTSVTDAVGAELIQSMEKPGANVTGTVDTHPEAIPNTVKFIANELKAKKLGMVYNAGEQNSRAQVDIVKKEAKKYGVEVVEASANTSADVKQATESLVSKVDAYYIITDNTVVSALDSVLDVATDKKIPVMVGELDSVKRGGFGAYGFSYYDIGYEAGQMAVQILKDGKKPADIPAAYPANLKFEVNKETADKLGIKINKEWNAEEVK